MSSTWRCTISWKRDKTQLIAGKQGSALSDPHRLSDLLRWVKRLFMTYLKNTYRIYPPGLHHRNDPEISDMKGRVLKNNRAEFL